MQIALYLFLVSIVFIFLINFYVRSYLAWENRHRRGINYYGKPLRQRKAFKKKIRLFSCLMPIAVSLEKLIRRLTKKKTVIPSIEYGSVYFPKYSCDINSIKRGINFNPQKNDIFVVTQMKCGTTWMQQLVYQILNHGNRKLTVNKDGHLYALSPWLESFDGVSLEQASRIGRQQNRLIKTHLPASLCPYSEQAKYIYMIRHPVSCYASILDYFKLMSGALSPKRDELLEWFCSKKMWFSSWPNHVKGWLGRSSCKNILICSFENMKADLRQNILRVSAFLQVSLDMEAIDKVLHKCSFGYMQEHEELFEMCPPNFCSIRGGRYFVKGNSRRFKSASDAEQKRIADFCAKNQIEIDRLQEQLTSMEAKNYVS